MAKQTSTGTKSTTASATDFFDAEDGREGFEDIDSSTIAIPFLRIAQQLSPQLNERKPEYIPGLAHGDFFNSVTKDVYGKEMEIVVAKFEHVYVEWLPDRGGLVQENPRLAVEPNRHGSRVGFRLEGSRHQQRGGSRSGDGKAQPADARGPN